MAKPKTKDSKATTFTLDVNVIEQLNVYSEETMIPKTRIVERAIIEYIERNTKKSGK